MVWFQLFNPCMKEEKDNFSDDEQSPAGRLVLVKALWLCSVSSLSHLAHSSCGGTDCNNKNRHIVEILLILFVLSFLRCEKKGSRIRGPFIYHMCSVMVKYLEDKRH